MAAKSVVNTSKAEKLSTPATTDADTITLDRSEAQLAHKNDVLVLRQCGDVRDEIKLIQVHATAMSRQIDCPNEMLDRGEIERNLCLGENAMVRLKDALSQIPFALLAVCVLALAGCGKHSDDDGRPRQMEVVNTCEGGQCQYRRGGNDH